MGLCSKTPIWSALPLPASRKPGTHPASHICPQSPTSQNPVDTFHYALPFSEAPSPGLKLVSDVNCL